MTARSGTERIRLAPQKRFAIGIDPGITTGVGVFDREVSRIVAVKRTDFFGVLPWLNANVRLADAKIFVEVPPKFMYGRNNDVRNGRDRYMADVGGNRREGLLLAELLRREGLDVEEVRPVMQKKWDLFYFQAATKWTGSAGEHERDACRLAMYYANKRQELGR